ncbi:MAG: DUF5682 family protein [Candidatus Sumerlaeia bacterium]|nr:DUF5682 family protein [Candidatus Sumerlaeia bacterium]
MTSAMDQRVAVFGIRHHGPGSARSLLRALEELRPDCVLVEGPGDATHLAALAADPAMKPPVALMVYDPEEPSRGAFYPFAEFSPEWQALRHAAAAGVPARFIDLPQRHWLALRKQLEEAAAAAAEPDDAVEADDSAVPGEAGPEQDEELPPEWRRDPLALLARAAGSDDPERWWEQLVEQRSGRDGVFEAVAEAMAAVRAEVGADERDLLREAWMRSEIREARKEGFERIAVVCGAWHAPALAAMPAAKEDAGLLRGLPKIKTEATWAPWTYERLASGSGYAAGVESPGWYEFLWRNSGAEGGGGLPARWLARVAAVLRERDFDVSPGHLIEAVRLVDALCAVRGVHAPGLREMDEAAVSVMLFGEPAPLALIRKTLVVGVALGEVPEGVPAPPLRADLERQQKRLRLKPTADHKDVDLDLRNATDLERSRLLHRLLLLDVHWGAMREAGGRGTFRESWRLQWLPELAVSVVAASVHGNTVENAAGARAVKLARETKRIAELATLALAVLPAELPDAVAAVMERLGALAAVSGDAVQLLDALPPLARACRYGDVRGTDPGGILRVFESMAARACIGLKAACVALDDEAAGAMAARFTAVDAAIGLLERAALLGEWRRALAGLLGGTPPHGLVAGRACRLLLDGGALAADEAAVQFGLALSRSCDAAAAGAWVEGFLGGSGMLLVHSDVLWGIVDGWLCGLPREAFIDVLPVLRRTFSRFEAAERRMMGERVRRPSGTAAVASPAVAAEGFDAERADAVLPLLAALLGAEAPS